MLAWPTQIDGAMQGQLHAAQIDPLGCMQPVGHSLSTSGMYCHSRTASSERVTAE